MALGLHTETSGGGDYNAIVKYDARAGRFFRVDRTEGASGWETNNADVTQGFTAIFDMDSVEVGWALFAAGVAPSFNLVRLGAALPAKPSENHKQAFRLMMKLGKSSGGDVREFASQAKVVIGAIDALHTKYEAEKAQHAGQLPVVSLTGTAPIKTTGKGQTSTNYQPVLEIVKWVDRPDDLPAPSAVVTSLPTAAASPPSASAQPVSQARTTSQVAPALDDEF